MPDLDLDMQKLFAAGLWAVLTVQHARREEYVELTVSMSRLANDSTLVVQSQETARHLCSLFCELEQAKPGPPQ